ncbi:MAG: YbjN domain-containing protein [bacterium]|nr:YbjN domain-containing protein [bacterium]
MQSKEQKNEFSVDIAPAFDTALLEKDRPVLDVEKWDSVVDLYDAKKYREAVLGILDYVDPDLIATTGNDEKTEFVIPHGSILVNLKIDNDTFSVSAPFLKIPPKNTIPLLRQVTQLNFHPLNLSGIVLEEEQLVFKYSCPLELCEPFKTYDIFREICSFADFYDDEFIKKFAAQRMHEPQIVMYSSEQADLAWEKVQHYLTEAVKYIDYLEEKRLLDFCFDILNSTLLKIYYYSSPQGILRTDIEKTISYFQDRDIQIADRIGRGKKFVKQLQEYDKQEFSKNLYTAELFIPYRSISTLEDIKTDFQNYYETAKKEIDGRYFMAAVLTLHSAFLNLFYHCIIPDEISEIITDALVKSSRKPWEESSGILWTAIDEIMTFEKPKKSRGFWRSLFGG